MTMITVSVSMVFFIGFNIGLHTMGVAVSIFSTVRVTVAT